MLKKVMMYTLNSWGTINLKCWSNSFVSRQTQVKLHGDESLVTLQISRLPGLPTAPFRAGCAFHQV